MEKNESKPMRKRGGQPGNQNARKHGFYTQDGRKRLEDMDALIRDCQDLLEALTDGDHSRLQRIGTSRHLRGVKHKPSIQD